MLKATKGYSKLFVRSVPRSLLIALLIFCLSVLIAVFTRLSPETQASGVLKGTKVPPQAKAGEFVVKLKPTVRGFGSGFGASKLQWDLSKNHYVTIQPLKMDDRFATVEIKNPVDSAAILQELKKNPAVEIAEPNYIYHTFTEESEPTKPNDPSFERTWGLFNFGQKDVRGQEGKAGSDIGATKAWSLGTGSKSIVVAVIDTGIDYNHEDLKDNMFVNVNEIPGNGIDDDANGFVDDVRGWNFEGKNNDPMDDNRHGTHCAGTIGAKGNNAMGVAGVNWNVSLMPVKFLSATGSGSLSDALESIKYATKMKVNVMSNSWGGGGFSQTMLEAIKDARDHGILFIAAAGNESNDNDAGKTYPASYISENVIAVAATDNRDHLAPWSNYGQSMVHLSAPGVNIVSTVPKKDDGSMYESLSGTSMATPHVAGAAALLWSVNRTMAYTDIKARLLATVDPVRTLKTKTLQGGRLNVYNAMANIVPVRSEPPTTGWKEMPLALASPHPYLDKYEFAHTITHPGAKFIRVHVVKLASEKGYDLLSVRDTAGEVLEEASGTRENFYLEWTQGETAEIRFNTDTSVSGWGFEIDRYEVLE